MTFLELCQAAAADSGLISSQNLPQTTANAVGKWGDIVRFTAQAWNIIQRSRRDWEFMRADFTHALTIGKSNYTPAELGITTRFARFASDVEADGLLPFHCYDPAIGVADDQCLRQISPEVWSQVYGRGTQDNNRPTDYALAGGKLYVGQFPDKAYTLLGSYWLAPQTLSLDSDVPALPDHYHDVIKWRAIMMVSGKDLAVADRTVAQAEYGQMFRQLVAEQTRPVNMGAPLA